MEDLTFHTSKYQLVCVSVCVRSMGASDVTLVATLDAQVCA